MKPFKFKVGQQVRSKYDGRRVEGVVIARTRYTQAVEKFNYTPGERLYMIDPNPEQADSLVTYVEHFLELVSK